MIKNIPNIVTLSNLFLGCIAVVFALHGKPHYAGLAIGGCALLDFADGFLARILKAGSALGQQLDSLADLISFGMAPAAIVFYYMNQVSLPDPNFTFLPYLAFLITVFSGLRLAIFNIDTRQSTSFIGLPVPANALFFASFPVVLEIYQKQNFIYASMVFLSSNLFILLFIVLLFSWFLVSPIGMFSLKFKSLKWKGNQVRFIFLMISLLLFIIFQLGSIPLIVIFYIILSSLQPLLGFNK